jgi:hypothetical protein
LSGNASTATTATNQSGGTVSATTGTFSGAVGFNGSVTFSGGVGGSEGGEVTFAKPASGTNFLGNIANDINGDSVRWFANYAGTTKVFSLNFAAADGVLLSSGNYNSYAPTLTGTGASGTWGINVTGNAATATALQTARTINGVSFNGTANITVADSTKLPLSGGTMTGTITTTQGNGNGINLNAAGSGFLFGTNQDAASSTQANVKLASWNGIGFSPSIGGQPVPQWENAVWIDCRTGAISGRGALTMSGTVAGTNITSGGNVTGSSTSCSGNAATATTATYLSGSGQINTIVGKNGTTADINAANDTGSFSIRGDASFPASVSFHRTGAYAINMGLSTGNNFVIGGWSASSNAFVMSGAGALTMLNNITAYSDERVKTNWRDLRPDFIERLAEVKHGIYDRTDQVSTQVGVSAQSLQKILEHAVMEGDDGHLSVAYGNAALVAAVKLAERVVALEARLAAIEAKG